MHVQAPMRRCSDSKKDWLEQVATYIGTALGAGANVRACELEAPCSSPVEITTQQTFSHFDAYIEGPPWGSRMSLIKT